MQNKKRILVLGAGFGGLRTAHLLARKLARTHLLEKYEVILIDRNEHHTYTPLLYEVATTSKEVANITHLHNLATYHIATLVKQYPITFIQDEIVSIHADTGQVKLKNKGSLDSHSIVIALGSQTNFYDIPGLQEHALSLKTFADAIAIRDRVWELALEENRCIRIVVGGAGSTGIELAGELQTWQRQLHAELPHCVLQVTLIEASSEILGGFPVSVIKRTRARLAKLGITVLTGKKIVAVEKTAVTLNNEKERVEFDVLIWTGGIKPSEVVTKMPLKVGLGGRVEVLNEMICVPSTPDLKLLPHLYGVGDNVCCVDPLSGKATACVAQAALAQAKIAAHNIVEDIKLAEGKVTVAQHKVYSPRQYPYIIPIGGKYAIAKVGPIAYCGFFAWLTKGLVELRYLSSIMPLSQAVPIWLKGLWVFVQNDQLG